MKTKMIEDVAADLKAVTYQVYSELSELDVHLRDCNDGKVLFIDLSLGEAKPFDCFAQLSIQIDGYEDRFTEQSKGITRASCKNTWQDIGDWIDRETRGELAVNICLQECEKIIPLLEISSIRKIAVIAPINHSKTVSYTHLTLPTICSV